MTKTNETNPEISQGDEQSHCSIDKGESLTRFAAVTNDCITTILNTIDVNDPSHQLWFKTWSGSVAALQAKYEQDYNERISKQMIGQMRIKQGCRNG